MQSYNFYADLLNKYSQLTPWVQTVVAVSFFAMMATGFYFIKEFARILISSFGRKIVIRVEEAEEEDAILTPDP